MFENLPVYLFIALLVPGVMWLISRSSRKEVLVQGGQQVSLRMNRFYQILGVLPLLMGLIFTLSILTDESEPDKFLIISMVWLVCLLLGAPLFLLYQNHQVSFDTQRITVSDWRGRVNSLKWEDITNANFKHMSGYLVLHHGQQTVKVHQHIVGLKSILRMLESQTKWTAKELRIPSA